MSGRFSDALRGDPRPDYLDDWTAWCAARIRGAVTAGLRVPSQRQLEHGFGEFWREREGDG